MQQVNVGVIGTGWCGGIRAVAASKHPLVRELHIAEINPDRLAEMTEMTFPESSTDDWEKLIANAAVDVVMVSATPETTHYPMAKTALEAGKHVLLEKPISITLDEADDLIDTAERNDLKFTIAYSQRFNPKHHFHVGLHTASRQSPPLSTQLRYNGVRPAPAGFRLHQETAFRAVGRRAGGTVAGRAVAVTGKPHPELTHAGR